MTDTAADTWYGAILKKETAPSSGSYSDFGLEVTSIAAPGMTRTAIDATHMQSPNAHTEMIFGISTSKPFTVEFNLDPSGVGTLQTAATGDPLNWQVYFPDASTATFKAGITDLDIAAGGPDGKMTGSLTFTPSGMVTWA